MFSEVTAITMSAVWLHNSCVTGHAKSVNVDIVDSTVLYMQVYTQPWFAFVEKNVYRFSGKSWFTHKEIVIPLPLLGSLRITAFRLIWRTAYVIFTTGKPSNQLLHRVVKHQPVE